MFEKIFLEVLDKHAPVKKKYIRTNHAPYMTKVLRKAIMRRSQLENKYQKYRSDEYKLLLRSSEISVARYTKKKEKNTFQN